MVMAMLLADLAATSRQVAETGSRLEKIRLLAACLRQVTLPEIEIAVHYLAGSLRQGRIGVGYALLQEVLPGEGASEPMLTLTDVDRAFEEIAHTTGAGSTARRRELLAALVAKTTRAEREFLLRLLLGELRQGALEAVMLEALAQAADLPAAQLRRAAMLAGDLAAVARAALAEGAAGLGRFQLRLLTPMQPMLAESAADTGEALARLGRASLEYKLDGARVQAHKDGSQVRVYTRSLHDVTDAVPEIVEALAAAPAHRLIADGEALALRADGAPQPFQVTMRRFGRKLDVAAMRAELPLTAFFFDALHLDGQDLLDRPQHERFDALAQALPSGLLIARRVTADAREAEAFFAEALARGHEGVMAKGLDAPYEAGNRGASWLKVKRAWTLDLVVLAAEWGHGRRQGLLSNLHLGARDPQGGFVMLGKTFKGLTDELLRWQTQKLLELEIGRDAYTVHVRPELVVEVAFNDIQTSPHYPGGLALRFARVKRYRADKRAADADSIDAVRAIYAGQQAQERAHDAG
jgi:DNA ligase-1